IVPVVVNFDQMVNAFDTYESRVVKVLGVVFVDPTGNFANGTVYACYDQDTDYNIRTSFYDVDYINTPIPSSPKDIVGIPNSRTDGNYFTPRALADFIDPAGTVAAPVFDPNGGVFVDPVSVSMSSATAGATIHYTLDGSNPTAASTQYVSPITIATTTSLKAIAVLPGSPSSGITTATFSFPVTVTNLSALRSSAVNGLYRVQNEVLLSFKQSFRNQMFLQDDQAGILIDDLAGVITTDYNVGDEIGNVVGTLTEFGGMLQLVPAQDFGQAVSTDNPVVPIPITIDQFINSFESYESRLVTIGSVVFSDSNSNFANGTVYPFTNVTATQTANFRSTFYDVDYIGVHMQPWIINITGIPNSRTDGNYLTA
ncbi:MAG TPA: chitobiase/beta-hexosaminidase C-terminal domain-containing protein, partial [Candidatus Cloacimonadota bacterium]|nr:chitobiase/beta-hexosaminidase C-terminal domain-containing protein [Candidatus Cloacimonadota bacterium]